MQPNDLLLWTRATPFVPFRIRLNSGRTFDIRHPEMVRVGFSSVHIYTFANDPPDVYERMEMISLALVESIEPLETRQRA